MHSNEDSTPHAPEVGALLAGKYRVEQVLHARGPVARLVAWHVPMDRRVTMKLLLGTPDAATVERFTRGARLAAQLRGEHAARVLDVTTLEEGCLAVVLEHWNGRAVAAELEARGPLPVEQAVRHVLEACEALAEAHAARVVHGNLTPRSLFLAERRGHRAIVKVLDFEDAGHGELTGPLLRGERSVAEAAYLAPEQRSAPKGVDARANQWGLGVVLYELLAGVRPFVGESPALLLSAILQGAPRPLREMRPDVPAGLEAAVSRCLRVPASERFADVAVLAAALAPFAAPGDRASAAVAARVLADLPAPPEEPSSAGERPRGRARVPTRAFAFAPEPALAVIKPSPPDPPRPPTPRQDPREEEATPEQLLSDALFESVRRPWEHRQTAADRTERRKPLPARGATPEGPAKPTPRDRRREEG